MASKTGVRGRLAVAAAGLAVAVAVPLVVAWPQAEAADAVAVTVDFGSPVTRRAATSVGVTVTGYGRGNYITNSVDHRARMSALAPGLMRVELKYATPGDPSSAVGCGGIGCVSPAQVSGEQWVRAIRELGAEPVVILPLDGRHAADLDVADAVNLYRYLADRTGTPVRRFIVGNELDNGGNPHHVDAAEYSRRFNLVADALRAVDPQVKLAGPATAYYNTGYIDRFLAGSGTRVDMIDFHKYGQGGDNNNPDDRLLGAVVDSYATDLADLRRRIDAAVPARAGQIGIQIGEYNVDWNGDPRMLTHFSTVWGAATLGTILSNGGTAIQYGDKNGQLGLTSETGEGGIAVNSPLPLYHGLSMFTGAGMFRAFGSTVVRSTSAAATVRVFASADPATIVLVNTGTTEAATRVALTGSAAASAEIWRSTGAQPAPHRGGTTQVSGGAIELAVPARSVATLVLAEGAQHGLTGTYFDNADFTGASATRVDPTLDFVWGQAAPHPSIGAETFSVRWTGGLHVDTSGSYTFTTSSDDGIRVRIGDTLVIDAFTNHSRRDDSGTVTLEAGRRYPVRVEYFDGRFDAVARLSWAGPGIAKQIVPTANLWPAA